MEESARRARVIEEAAKRAFAVSNRNYEEARVSLRTIVALTVDSK